LFKKSVEKHTEKIELEQETIWQISEKQQTLTIENKNAQEVVQIRSDSVSYNPHSGDFRAKGNVAIISTKKQAKQSEKQDFLTVETQSQKTDFSTNKAKKPPINKSKNVKPRLFSSYFYTCCYSLSVILFIGKLNINYSNI